MTIEKELKECFTTALKDENRGFKHKGLLARSPNKNKADEYIQKAKKNLELCYLFKEQGIDYKIPEEWFYTLYYCALAILSNFGIESRSQRCTALFLRHAKDKGFIDYKDEFIDRITVHKERDKKSDVDQRENARYSSSVTSEEIKEQFDNMSLLCKEAISQCEEIVYLNQNHKVIKELLEELDIYKK